MATKICGVCYDKRTQKTCRPFRSTTLILYVCEKCDVDIQNKKAGGQPLPCPQPPAKNPR